MTGNERQMVNIIHGRCTVAHGVIRHKMQIEFNDEFEAFLGFIRSPYRRPEGIWDLKIQELEIFSPEEFAAKHNLKNIEGSKPAQNLRSREPVIIYHGELTLIHGAISQKIHLEIHDEEKSLWMRSDRKYLRPEGLQVPEIEGLRVYSSKEADAWREAEAQKLGFSTAK